MSREFKFVCCVDPSHVFITEARGIAVARLRAHAVGWASTSMDSPTVQDICPKCANKHKNYAPGRPFKRSVFAEMHKNVIGKQLFPKKVIAG